MMGTSKLTPNPGSREAIDQGCTCPVIDNHHGAGVPMGKNGAPLFWHSENCSLHGRAVGQIRTIDGWISPTAEYQALGRELPANKASVPGYNDHPSTTHADNMALFDRAIQAQEERGNG